MQQAARVSQRTAYFHLGDLVEVGATDRIFNNPRHQLTEDYITGRSGRFAPAPPSRFPGAAGTRRGAPFLSPPRAAARGVPRPGPQPPKIPACARLFRCLGPLIAAVWHHCFPDRPHRAPARLINPSPPIEPP